MNIIQLFFFEKKQLKRSMLARGNSHQSDIDDTILEINAMIKRVTRVKARLKRQKQYIDASIEKVEETSNENSLMSDTPDLLSSVDRYLHSKNITDNNTGKDIFRSTGTILNDSEGMTIEDVKRFFIAVNAVLGQTNDETSTIGGNLNENDTLVRDAIVPLTNKSITDETYYKINGEFSMSYKAGGSHRINTEVLKGLIPGDYSGESLISENLDGSIAKLEDFIDFRSIPEHGEVLSIKVPEISGGITIDGKQTIHIKFVKSGSMNNSSKLNHITINTSSISDLNKFRGALIDAISGVSKSFITQTGQSSTSTHGAGVPGIRAVGSKKGIDLHASQAGANGNNIEASQIFIYYVKILGDSLVPQFAAFSRNRNGAYSQDIEFIVGNTYVFRFAEYSSNNTSIILGDTATSHYGVVVDPAMQNETLFNIQVPKLSEGMEDISFRNINVGTQNMRHMIFKPQDRHVGDVYIFIDGDSSDPMEMERNSTARQSAKVKVAKVATGGTDALETRESQCRRVKGFQLL